MDIFHIFGNDLVLTNTGDLLTVEGDTESQQRVLRRLLTAIDGYIWHTTYGAGLPQYIGQNLTNATIRQLTGLIKTQMFLEDTVSQSPEPKISISQLSNNTISCDIIYQSKTSGKVFTLSFIVD